MHIYKSIKRKVLLYANRLRIKKYSLTFSQSGEDVIIRKIMSSLGIINPTYLDIGAYDPFILNNTALFYLRGGRGINIEPNPYLFKKFKRKRGKDINLNIGIGEEKNKVDFYIIDPPTLSTYSKSEAERLVREEGFVIKDVIKTEVDTINNIVREYCGNVFPDILSLDVEGKEKDIIFSLNFNKSMPMVVCLETVSYSAVGRGTKDKDIISHMKTKGYMVYADTYINTIFVKKDVWIR